MRFHMHLLPTYFPDRDPPFDVYYQQVLEQVALAEELGWDCFWFTEHHFLLYGGPMPNPAAIMCAAAARTSRIHLGSAISILPLHHPVEVAENYAMVDVLSGGRLEFGIGLGNTAVDFQVYGIPREESRARFEEAAEVVLKAWTNERFNHDGRFWHFKDVPVYPRPVQQPTPPIWVAGHSPESLGWAGRHGFNIMTVAHPFPPEHYAPGLVAWRGGAGQDRTGTKPAPRQTPPADLGGRGWGARPRDRGAGAAPLRLHLDRRPQGPRSVQIGGHLSVRRHAGDRAQYLRQPGPVHRRDQRDFAQLPVRHLQHDVQLRRPAPRGGEAVDAALRQRGDARVQRPHAATDRRRRYTGTSALRDELD